MKRARGGDALARIRKLCLARPETSERLSHGAPTFFVRGKKAFVMYLTVAPKTLIARHHTRTAM